MNNKQEQIVKRLEDMADQVKDGAYGVGNDVDGGALMDELGVLADEIEEILEEDADLDDMDDEDDENE